MLNREHVKSLPIFSKSLMEKKSNAELKAKKEAESVVVMEKVSTPTKMTPTVSQDSNGMPDISGALNAWSDEKSDKKPEQSITKVNSRGLNLANIKAVENLSLNSGEPS